MFLYLGLFAVFLRLKHHFSNFTVFFVMITGYYFMVEVYLEHHTAADIICVP